MRFWIYLLIIFMSAYALESAFNYGIQQSGINIIIMMLAIILNEIVKISEKLNLEKKAEGKETNS